MNSIQTPGKIILAGAGCGDPELVTVKTIHAIKQADVLVYDSLISEELLDYCMDGCEKIYVGKRCGCHSATQDDINKILIKHARLGKTVVRLKGGDPFVFGRGGEEILAIQAEHIPYEVIPGISSCIAVPAAAGIPVTHRELARSFHVITGHTSHGLAADFETLAKLDGTLVFLMGLHHLGVIADELIRFGKNPSTPAAVISAGTLAHQKCVRAALCDIDEKVRTSHLVSPCVIVIGDVAAMDLTSNMPLPNHKISIAVTGTDSFTRRMKQKLDGKDFACIRYPYCKLCDTSYVLKEIDFSQYSMLCFTSSNGVNVFFDALKNYKIDIRRILHMKFAAIGTGTAHTLEKLGIIADFVPDEYTAQALGTELVEFVKSDEKLLLLRAEKGSAILTEMLEKHHISFSEYKTYDIQIDSEIVKTATEHINDADYIVFGSASGADGYFQNGGTISQSQIVCIGDATADAVKKYTDKRLLCAAVHTAEGILEVITKDLGYSQ